MGKNIKLYIFATTTTILLLLLLLIIINSTHKKTVFHCSHTISIDINKERKAVQFRNKTEYILFDDGSGDKIDVGTMSINGKEYILNRHYRIKYHISNGYIYMIITDINKSNKDTAPTDENLLQINENIYYRTKIQLLFGGAYLIDLQGYPVTVCTK